MNKNGKKIQEHSEENHSQSKWIPEDKLRIRVFIPTPKSQVCFTNLEFVDLSQET
jgi:hypothetical protein